jgi:hypothetical protein
MKDLVILGTEQTPEVSFLANGTLKISGVSIPENVIKFYEPILNWLTELEKSNPANISLTIDFEYINSSSLNILLFKLFSKIIEFGKKKSNLKVVWIYPEGDDDIEDVGKNMEEVLDFKFEFICK